LDEEFILKAFAKVNSTPDYRRQSAPLAVQIKVTLLSPERCKSIEIVLGRLKLPIGLICKSLLSFDVLNMSMIESLIGICPTEEEIQKLKEYEGNKAVLGTPE
jgi:dishevelled associated activator of morphogenesis